MHYFGIYITARRPKNALSQWFLNLMSNQAKADKLAAWTWFDRRLKNHRLLTRIVGTHFHQGDILKITMNISNILTDLDRKLI